MTHVLEIEQKYDATGDLPALDELPDAAATVHDTGITELTAVYFDTHDLDLRTAGISLRRREGGGDEGWHLKLPMGRDRRLEVRVPLSRGIRTVPKELRSAVLAYTQGSTLTPIAVIETVRRSVHVLDLDGSVLAEVVDDQVTAGDLAWREWEVELGTGDERLLAAVAARLRDAGARRSKVGSKLERVVGTGVRERPERPVHKVGRKSPAANLVRERLATLVDAIPARDISVRRNLPDGVHRLRVTIRRIRQLLASFEPLLDPSEVQWFRGELKWLADCLGAARDAEVVSARLKGLLADQSDESGAPAAARAVQREMTRRYREAHRAAVVAMESQRYLELLAALRGYAEEPSFRKRAAKPTKRVLPGIVDRDVARLEKRLRRLGDPADPDYVERLHEARKAAKRVRYLAEACRPVYGKPARRSAREMKAFQSYVGEHQDVAMTRTALRVIAAQTDPAGRVAFVLGRVDVVEEQAAASVVRGLGRAWKQAEVSRIRKWAR
ncbi:CYTH and CHAD domain-containing protein [Nocardioides iriomotensis]|uniref:CYTH and CHAD domain-containing protein n=1 Tax=Nocardioides iriomotensis TaxID=715784 RepID=A0A4Q5JAQ5_9ACTN|nr:CYTH and CHAD domain-containing protein [Nocardioides iriomotensis]RYU15118.1 CYTH and CHAD domain-containing protein [Nocardioides iriomotensis]